ncbi:hypothetical protein Tco_1148947 [Tanacetum coccineum]
MEVVAEAMNFVGCCSLKSAHTSFTETYLKPGEGYKAHFRSRWSRGTLYNLGRNNAFMRVGGPGTQLTMEVDAEAMNSVGCCSLKSAHTSFTETCWLLLFEVSSYELHRDLFKAGRGLQGSF